MLRSIRLKILRADLFYCSMQIDLSENKAVYTATEVACGWAGAVIKKAIEAIGQEQ